MSDNQGSSTTCEGSCPRVRIPEGEPESLLELVCIVGAVVWLVAFSSHCELVFSHLVFSETMAAGHETGGRRP